MYCSNSSLRRCLTYKVALQKFTASRFRCACILFWVLGICCILYLLMLPSPSSKSAQLQRQNESLAQAAALSRQLRELSLGHFSHQSLSSAFRSASQHGQAAPHTAQGQQASDSFEHTTEFNLLVAKAWQILSALSSVKPVTTCAWDATMPLELFNKNSKVLLAANMHNNEDLLPHFSLQMLHFLTSLPSGSAFLSIYESGSTDSTGMDQAAVNLFC